MKIQKKVVGVTAGLAAGAAGVVAGAKLGAGVGIAMGPLGVMAGAITGAVICGLAGDKIRGKFYPRGEDKLVATGEHVPATIDEPTVLPDTIDESYIDVTPSRSFVLKMFLKYVLRSLLYRMMQLFGWARRHPKSVIAGAVVAIACVQPGVIIDSAEYLSGNVIYTLSETTTEVTSEALTATIRTPFMIISRTIENLLPWLPPSLHDVLTGVIAVIIFVLCIPLFTPCVLYVKKFLKKLFKKLFAWIKSGSLSIFQRIKTRGKLNL